MYIFEVQCTCVKYDTYYKLILKKESVLAFFGGTSIVHLKYIYHLNAPYFIKFKFYFHLPFYDILPKVD